jgi:hypothetical protein
MISDNIINIPPRVGESRISLASNKKLSETFNWNPNMKLERWIEKKCLKV